ncbi:MAG: hypothetical protein L3K09_02410 [Thermoplasmata archaeon]|nr:hypothetical protein [Thermoplasmata archaeon]
MTQAVSEKCKQDDGRVLPALGQMVAYRAALGLAPYETVTFHLPKTSGEHPGRKTRIVPAELGEAMQLEEGEVANDQKGPLSSQSKHALSNRVVLVTQHRRRRRQGRYLTRTPHGWYPPGLYHT